MENSLGMGVWNSKKAILLLTLHLIKGNNATTHMHIASAVLINLLIYSEEIHWGSVDCQTISS